MVDRDHRGEAMRFSTPDERVRGHLNSNKSLNVAQWSGYHSMVSWMWEKLVISAL